MAKGYAGAFTQNVIGLRQQAGEIAYDLTGGHLDVEHDKTIGKRIVLPSGPKAATTLSPLIMVGDWLRNGLDQLSAPHIPPA